MNRRCLGATLLLLALAGCRQILGLNDLPDAALFDQDGAIDAAPTNTGSLDHFLLITFRATGRSSESCRAR